MSNFEGIDIEKDAHDKIVRPAVNATNSSLTIQLDDDDCNPQLVHRSKLENPVEHEHRHYPAPAAQDTSYLPWSITNAQDRTLFLKLTLKRFYTRHTLAYLTCIGLLVIAGLLAYFGYEKDTNRSGLCVPPPGSADGIILAGQVINIDETQELVTINWVFGGWGNFSDSEPGTVGNLKVDARIFLGGTSDPVAFFFSKLESNYVSQSFQTKQLTTANALTSNKATTIQYPFDRYSIVAPFSALEIATNNSITITHICTLGSLQWQVNATDMPFGFEGIDFQDPTGRLLIINLSRSAIVKGFCIVVVCVTWSITLVIIYVTLQGTLFSRNLSGPLLALPATILFALPALRKTQPDVPTFGTYIDLFSFMITETVVAVCLVAMVAVHVARCNFSKMEAFHLHSQRRNCDNCNS